MTNEPSGGGGRRLLALVVALVLAAAAGAGGYAIGRRSVPVSPLAGGSQDGEVVARFEGYTLTLRDLEKQIAAQPAPIRERLAAGWKSYLLNT